MSNCILFLHSSYSILCYTGGSRDGKECDFIEVDQRSTYKPLWTSTMRSAQNL